MRNRRHALEHEIVAAVLARLDLGDPADTADREQRRRPRRRQRSGGAGSCRFAGRAPSNRRSSRGSAARRCAAANACRGNSSAPAQRKHRQPGVFGAVVSGASSSEQDSRQSPPLRGNPGVLQPDHVEQFEQLLPRGALVPFAIGGDDAEQRDRRRRRGRPPPSGRPPVRSACRDRPGWRRLRRRGRRDRRPAWLPSPARAPISRARSRAAWRVPRAGRRSPHRPRRSGPAATSARSRPDSTAGWSGAISAIWSKIAKRALAVALGQDFLAHRDQRLELGLGLRRLALHRQLLQIWSSIAFSWVSVRALVRSATSCPWNIA